MILQLAILYLKTVIVFCVFTDTVCVQSRLHQTRFLYIPFFSVFSNDPAWFRCQVRTRAVPACPYCRLQGCGDKGPLACRKMRLKWTNGFKFTLTIHIHTNMAFLVVLLLCIVYFQIYNNIIPCYVTSMVLVHGETHRNYTVFHVNVSTQQATFNSSHGCSQLFAFFYSKS